MLSKKGTLISYKIHTVTEIRAFQWKKEPLDSGPGYCCLVRLCLGTFTSLISVFFFVMRQLDSDSEVTLWHPRCHIWPADVSLWLTGHFGDFI